jgi:IS30 family transposase
MGGAMGIHYDQLCLCERKMISRLHEDGRSVRSIARALCRSASTISRELRRNAKPTKVWRGGYDPGRADGLAGRRRRMKKRFKLERQPALRAIVGDLLAMGWSPEQIAGRLARNHGCTVISHESIYRFVYHRRNQKDYWHRLLPRAKHRRGKMRRGGVNPVDHIRHRIPVHQRSDEANARLEEGHWEADLMMFSRYGQAVLVAHERTSRYTVITRQPNKAAEPVLERLSRLFTKMPGPLRRSITFDNGTEFALHYKLNDIFGMRTYFCDPHAPWQKGGVENAIARLRRRLPRKSDLAKIRQADLNAIVDVYNNTPRKCLGFRTPKEVFSDVLNRVALQT